MPVSVHHPNYKALRTALATFRRSAGLSQVQLAQQLGVGQSYISKIERAEAYVDVFVYVDWLVACNVNPGIELNRLIKALPKAHF